MTLYSPIDRRRLLTLFAQSTAALVLERSAASAQTIERQATAIEGYTFLSRSEVRFLDAAVSRIIPTDELGPGAKEAGVVVFLDRELGGDYGANVRTYTDGPYGPYTPYQGYQLPITVADVYRISIDAVDRYCIEALGKPFADLTSQAQDNILAGVNDLARRTANGNAPADLFFQLLLRDTKDGYFSDPIYGGNRHMIGWKLIGYPGAGRGYLQDIFKINTPYTAAPVGMAEHQHSMGMGDD